MNLHPFDSFNQLKDNRRREFLQKAFWVFTALPMAGLALSACTKSPSEEDASKAGGVTTPQNKLPDNEPKPVDENDAVAASLGYKHNADKVDKAKFAKKAGPGGDKQTCDNCQFYTAKSADWGACQIIQAGLVAKGGWCNSWQAKPGA